MEPPWFLPQPASCRNQRLEPAEPDSRVSVPGGGASAPNKEPGAGEAARYRSRERERGRPEYSGGWTVPKAWGRRGGGTSRGGWRGARALPSPPTHQALAKTGSVQARGSPGGRSLLFIRPDPHFSQPTHPQQEGTSHPTALPSPHLFHQLDFWGHKSCPPAAFPTLTPATLSGLTYLDSFKKKKKKSLPRTKHCAGHSSGPVAMPSHPSPWASPLPFHVPRPSRAPCPKAYESLLCAPQPLGYSHWSHLQAGR